MFFGNVGACLILPPGTGVVLVVVFFTVAGRVSCVMYPVLAMLHFHGGTGVKLALQLTAPLLTENRASVVNIDIQQDGRADTGEIKTKGENSHSE
jgi:hypothetical protein